MVNLTVSFLMKIRFCGGHSGASGNISVNTTGLIVKTYSRMEKLIAFSFLIFIFIFVF